ncbi:MAG: hypothetical protein NVS2B17_09900 [Candidatus Velthaea sp.]
MKAAALVVAIVCFLGCIAAAWLHANPAVLGGLAAIAFFGIAVWAGGTAVDLRGPDDDTEPRYRNGPSHPAPLPPDAIPRKRIFGKLWGATLAALSLVGIVPVISLARRPSAKGTAWSRGARVVTADNKPLKPGDLDVGGVETVFPENMTGAPESATMLIRLPDGAVQLPPDRAGWTPGGNVAYSKICTHAGCPVALYRHASRELYCPCHQSVFDVASLAKPKSGPATRALPQLGLDVDREGFLIARGDFVDPVGPDEWSRPI